MISKHIMLAATALVAITMCSPAVARDIQSTGAQGNPATTNEGDKAKDDDATLVDTVIVKGIRGSLDAATKKKKDSAQIVESIVSEDVGKLPDNNVPEALSRVTGVQIERIHGEGTNITIRGIQGISTTINGNSNSVGEGRSANLADIPAELLKSVQVYKTRTADQVEGGIAGTVNVELRRPLDLKNGWTLAGSVKNVYGSTGDTKSPYASLLVANRFDTGIGEMGFLINASYTKNRYEEDFVESESPARFFGTTLASLPASQQDIIAPYAVNYGVERGTITRPSINVAGQWRANEHLDFVVEGSYFGSSEKRARDRLHTTVRQDGHTVSNVVLADDHRTVQSLTLSRAAGVDASAQSYYEDVDSDNYTTNLEAHWHNDRLQINSSAQYNWSSTNYYGILSLAHLLDSTGKPISTVNVDLNSKNVPGRGPYVSFPTTDLSNVNNYQIFQVHDEQTYAKSHEFVFSSDATYRLSEDGFFRSLMVGVRYNDRHTTRDYGYRDAFPTSGLSNFVSGVGVEASKLEVGGFSPTWYHLSGKDLMANAAGFRAAAGWTTVKPSNNLGQSYVDDEKSLAAFGNLNYAINSRFPIDGVAGVRVVRTKGSVNSARYTLDANWNETITEATGGGKYVDVLPSINAVIHFTPKVQLRLAYTYNVQRPNFLDLSTWQTIETVTHNIFSGNPDLKPNRSTNYDASLEYYFGRGGIVSLGAFLKKPDGYMYYTPEDEVINGETWHVFKNRNAGPGEFQGYEANASGFFDFLPGKWRNFGASANFTYMAKYEIAYPFEGDQKLIPGVYDADSTSRYTYNLALYYDTPQFSARVAYNYRARYKVFVWQEYPEYSPYNDATSRLDAAVNWTPIKQLTLSLEGSNLLKENNNVYWGENRILPLGARVQARTLQVSARFRY
ncbi:TonB-dependent receptor [Caulobacter sp. AP07]|uniref:TonB-dependent receptor n=1 Tax=Caulobacter sp. AP07 TaxID=1144304 RepID=UPI0002721FDB|nr:TonB-dependent receptor [Caulobacter sp. AP07]EJL36508.1 TonB-dependent receptor [Caulobacter sp. AP07]